MNVKQAFMIVTASIFSHQTRNVDRKFLQSNLIMYAMYQIAVMIVVGVAVVALVEGEANTVCENKIFCPLCVFRSLNEVCLF